MDCIVHGVAKSRTRLSDFHFDFSNPFNLLLRGMKTVNVLPPESFHARLPKIEKLHESCKSLHLCRPRAQRRMVF